MSATPARDALVALSPSCQTFIADDGYPAIKVRDNDEAVDVFLANPDLALAALVEAGWTPTDEQLRAMGGRVMAPPTATHTGSMPVREVVWAFASMPAGPSEEADTYVPCEACELEVPKRLAVVEPQSGGWLCDGCVRVLRGMSHRAPTAPSEEPT